MGIEKVIRKLEEMAADREDVLPGCLGWDEAKPLREAVALLKTHPEARPNEPLTLEELRKMEGQPVWIERHGYGRKIGWAIVGGDESLYGVYFGTRYGLARLPREDCGYAWIAYRRPPKED